jgi:hypothetical protein
MVGREHCVVNELRVSSQAAWLSTEKSAAGYVVRTGQGR